MNHSSTVWILSFEESWFVGIGAGYYARPLQKREAIREARRLARRAIGGNRSGETIQIRSAKGEVIDEVVA